MKLDLNSIRPFVGSKNYATSRAFYRDLGFEEVVLSNNLSLFQSDSFGFYLQDYFDKAWLENTMLFLEVKDVLKEFNTIKELGLTNKFPGTEIRPMRKESWGDVFYVIDPAGILLHIAQFTKHAS